MITTPAVSVIIGNFLLLVRPGERWPSCARAVPASLAVALSGGVDEGRPASSRRGRPIASARTGTWHHPSDCHLGFVTSVWRPWVGHGGGLLLRLPPGIGGLGVGCWMVRAMGVALLYSALLGLPCRPQRLLSLIIRSPRSRCRRYRTPVLVWQICAAVEPGARRL